LYSPDSVGATAYRRLAEELRLRDGRQDAMPADAPNEPEPAALGAA
jgi:hypothetical protein